MPRNIMVVGMPRSGTSMVTGIFTRAGYFVSDEPDDDLRPGDMNNPDGYWEAESLIQRNAAILDAAGYPHHNTWLFDPVQASHKVGLRSLKPDPAHAQFVEEYNARSPWVWKDPRLCYTMGYWWRLVDPSTTRVVLTSRDPEAIYHSFVRLRWREDTPDARTDVLARIEDHLAFARSTIRDLGIPYIEVPYDDFATDPGRIASELSEFCDLQLAPEDLGFNRRFDHSGLRGRLATSIDQVVTRLPAGPRKLLKRVTPRAVVRALFPERE